MYRFRNGFDSSRGSATAKAGIPAAFALWFAILVFFIGALAPRQAGAAASGSEKFIPTFLVYYSGGPTLTAADAPKLAKFDLIDIGRFRHGEIGSNTWAAIKSLNPAVKIYLYEMGPEAPSHLDSTAQMYLNGLGRHNVSRGHFMGSLNGNHPGLFLLDSSGNRVYNASNSNPGANQYWYLMDFGAIAYQSYWLAAVKADIVDQPWVADGVFAENCLARASGGGYSAVPSLYSTHAAWSDAMNQFANSITAGLSGYGQKLWCTGGGAKDTVLNVYVKTDPKAGHRQGMSLFLVDNDTPGLEVRKLDKTTWRVACEGSATLVVTCSSNAFAPVSEERHFRSLCYAEGEAISRDARKAVSALPAEIPAFYREMDAFGAWTPLPVIVAGRRREQHRPEEIGETVNIAVMQERWQLESRLGDDADWLGSSSLLCFACRHEGETLAVAALFRDRRTGFDTDAVKVLRTISGLFGEQLARWLPAGWTGEAFAEAYRQLNPAEKYKAEQEDEQRNRVWLARLLPADWLPLLTGLTFIGFGLWALRPDELDAVLERNPYWFGVDARGRRLPYLDELVYRVAKDQDLAAQMFHAGELDGLDNVKP